MRNKRSMEVSPTSVVIGAALLGLIFVVFVWGILPILTEKQIPFIKGQTEDITQDCDGDGYTGIVDACPCDPNINEKSQKCGQPVAPAPTNCPTFCKIEKKNT